MYSRHCERAGIAANGLVAAVPRRGAAAILEALPAVHGLVVARLEGDFRVLPAAGADSRVHLARAAGVPTAAAAAVRATTTAAAVAAGGVTATTVAVSARVVAAAAASV